MSPLVRRTAGGSLRRPRRWAVRGALVLLVSATAYVAWSGGLVRRAVDPTRQGVVFLGDSITSGDGVPSDVTFTSRLGVALGVPVRNAGISGDTATGALQRLD